MGRPAWGLTLLPGSVPGLLQLRCPLPRLRRGMRCRARRLPLRDGYCRLCWCQARHDRAGAAADARSAVVLAPWLARVRRHQLFFADMDSRRAAPGTMPRRRGEKGRPLKAPPPVAARPGTSGLQLAPFDRPSARDYRQVRFDLRRDHAPANPWPARALYLAHLAGEARGGQPVAEDRPDLFTSWLDAKLAGLATGLAREPRRWAVTLHDGGPRTRARSPHPAQAYVRATRPALLAWSARYDHLREVTRDDILAYLADLYAFRAAAGCQSELELDDTAGAYQSGLD